MIYSNCIPSPEILETAECIKNVTYIHNILSGKCPLLIGLCYDWNENTRICTFNSVCFFLEKIHVFNKMETEFSDQDSVQNHNKN